jgi:hypothetical protein
MESLLRAFIDDQQWKILEDTGTVKFLHAPDVGGQELRVKVFKAPGQIRFVARSLC